MKTIEKKACYEQPKMAVINVKVEGNILMSSGGDDEEEFTPGTGGGSIFGS